MIALKKDNTYQCPICHSTLEKFNTQNETHTCPTCQTAINIWLTQKFSLQSRQLIARAWDQLEQKMHYEPSFVGEIIKNTLMQENPRYQIMFATEKRNICGQLLFDGDIAIEINANNIGVIFWDDTSSSYIFRYLKKSQETYVLLEFGNFNKIGNVFENPEILPENWCKNRK